MKKASILLSIFKRKGGEGIFTKIITNENKINFDLQLRLLNVDEEAIVCFKEDELNWVLLTNKRLIKQIAGAEESIKLSAIKSVTIALKEEFADKNFNKLQYSRLRIDSNNGVEYLLKLEKGEPFQGFYQVLHFVCTNKD